MKVLITGHLGVIGEIISKPLSDMGFDIIGYDIVSGDNILDTHNLIDKLIECDACIHLAGIPGPRPKLPFLQFYRSNILGTISVLNACEVAGINRFIYSSSGAVYGFSTGTCEPIRLPMDEHQPFSWTLDDYDISKVVCEDNIRHSKIETRIALRLETPYPPCEAIISHLCTEISQENLVEAFRASLESDFTGYGAFNIGNNEISPTFNAMEVQKRNWPHVPNTIRTETDTLYSIEKAREFLGFNPV